jgi:hypothetical protein
MNPNSKPVAEKHAEGIASVSVILARVMWTLLGPALAGLAALAIAMRGTGWLTPMDAFYGIVIALMISGRWVEQRSGSATTVTGSPATIHHFHRYVIILLLVSAVVWVVANVIGNHIRT